MRNLVSLILCYSLSYFKRKCQRSYMKERILSVVFWVYTSIQMMTNVFKSISCGPSSGSESSETLLKIWRIHGGSSSNDMLHNCLYVPRWILTWNSGLSHVIAKINFFSFAGAQRSAYAFISHFSRAHSVICSH